MKKKVAAELYTLTDLDHWREVTRDVNPPIRLGVFGDPAEHSLSPQMQNAALKHCQIEMQYARFQISPNGLHDALSLVRELNFIGVNLTIPHKIAAASLVDELDESAKRVGAANTIKIDTEACSHQPVAGHMEMRAKSGARAAHPPSRRSGVAHSAVVTVESNKRMRGFNTDGRGFSRAIREEFSVDLRDMRVLVLGAGGAGRAIAMQCARENCERLVIANRTFGKAKQLANELGDFFAGPKVFGPVPRLQAIGWEENAFRFQIANIDLIVNATSLGLSRADASPIPPRLLAPHLMIYDTIYSRERTPFVSAAIEAGARGANGLSMLLHQGALAFEIWFQREAPLEAMRKAL
jgi:shikimate dehydrogenase